MTLAIDGSSPTFVSNQGSTTAQKTLTTASFTAPANSLILAIVEYNSQSSSAWDHTVTDSGGLTWTLQARKSYNSSSLGGRGVEGGVELWTASPTAAASRTVTATVATTSGGYDWHDLTVRVITDTGGTAPTIGNIYAGSSASGLPSLTVTTTSAGSWVWAGSSDWSSGSNGTAATVGSNQTKDTEITNTPYVAMRVWRYTNPTATSGSNVTINLTAPSGQKYNMLAWEVKQPVAGTDVTVAGSVANASSSGKTGTVSASRVATIAGSASTGSATGKTGTATASRVVTILGAVATASAVALAGAESGTANVSGGVSTGSAAANTGTAVATRVVTALGDVAAASSAANAGVAVAVRDTTVAGSVGSGSAAAGTGATVTTQAVTVSGSVASATAQALTGATGTGVAVTVIGATATADAAALPGAVAAAQYVQVAGGTSGGTAQAYPGEVVTTSTSGVLVAGYVAAGSATAYTGSAFSPGTEPPPVMHYPVSVAITPNLATMVVDRITTGAAMESNATVVAIAPTGFKLEWEDPNMSNWHVGDTWPPVVLTLKNSDGTAVDLSAAGQIKLHSKPPGNVPVIDVPMQLVTDGKDGKVTYQWAATDLSVKGTYLNEVEVTWGTGQVQTFPAAGTISHNVDDQLA